MCRPVVCGQPEQLGGRLVSRAGRRTFGPCGRAQSLGGLFPLTVLPFNGLIHPPVIVYRGCVDADRVLVWLSKSSTSDSLHWVAVGGCVGANRVLVWLSRTTCGGSELALTPPPHRCATGEAWQSIMLACIKGRPCDPRSYTENEPKDRKCGSDLAYGYFVSFIFFWSFLVRLFPACCSWYEWIVNVYIQESFDFHWITSLFSLNFGK